jgi:hypothetical protein
VVFRPDSVRPILDAASTARPVKSSPPSAPRWRGRPTNYPAASRPGNFGDLK